MKKSNVLTELLEKYYKRVFADGDIPVRRVSVSCPSFKTYEDAEEYYQSLTEYINKRFINVKFIKESTVVAERVDLNIESVPLIEEYFKHKNKQFKTLTELTSEFEDLLKRYSVKGKACQLYAESLACPVYACLSDKDIEKIFAGISRIENNRNPIYLRELSQELYGDTKVLDTGKVINKIIDILKQAYPDVADKANADVLATFNVLKPDENIHIRGSFFLETDGGCLDVSALSGGIVIPKSSLKNIKHIKVAGDEVLTVENLTAYEHLTNASLIYLGGFATKEQINLIRFIYSENPTAQYCHFGDLDAGGLKIFKNLRDETGVDFKTKYMSNEINKPQYAEYSKSLTANDKTSLTGLLKYPETAEIASQILTANKKLEQEIICRFISL